MAIVLRIVLFILAAALVWKYLIVDPLVDYLERD